MIQRKISSELKEHLDKKEISLLVGPRQAGKTTIMLLLKEELEKHGKKTIFLSLDIESDQPYFLSQQALLNKIQLELGRETGYVFIDEIQRKQNAGLFLKGLYDLNLPYKFIVSGSGSLELKEKIHESLAGRKRIFDVNTISFEEFVNFKTEYRYEDRIKDFLSIETDKVHNFLEEYLNFGGYPRVVLETSLQEKRKIMDEIYRSYLERDIAYLLKVEKLEAFSALIKILAGQSGQLVNLSELSSTLGISLKTIQNYLWYAQKTFIIEKLTPYFRNPRKEITKSPVIYFTDVGFRNYALGLWGHRPAFPRDGFLFQNFVFGLLKEKLRLTEKTIHFWRTKDKAEVDFVLDKGSECIPVEVKYSALKKPEAGRSLRNFIARYKPRQAWVVNLSLRDNLKINGAQVTLFPFYDLVAPQENLFGL